RKVLEELKQQLKQQQPVPAPGTGAAPRLESSSGSVGPFIESSVIRLDPYADPGSTVYPAQSGTSVTPGAPGPAVDPSSISPAVSPDATVTAPASESPTPSKPPGNAGAATFELYLQQLTGLTTGLTIGLNPNK